MDSGDMAPAGGGPPDGLCRVVVDCWVVGDHRAACSYPELVVGAAARLCADSPLIWAVGETHPSFARAACSGAVAEARQCLIDARALMIMRIPPDRAATVVWPPFYGDFGIRLYCGVVPGSGLDDCLRGLWDLTERADPALRGVWLDHVRGCARRAGVRSACEDCELAVLPDFLPYTGVVFHSVKFGALDITSGVAAAAAARLIGCVAIENGAEEYRLVY